MTFKNFERAFHSKYPEGEVIAHGKLGGTETTKKTTVMFTPGGKCYCYSGSYEMVLEKIGVKAISKSTVAEMEKRLARWKEEDGQESVFGFILDFSRDINQLEVELDDIRRNYMVI